MHIKLFDIKYLVYLSILLTFKNGEDSIFKNKEMIFLFLRKLVIFMEE